MPDAIEVLLIEDRPEDAELAMMELRRHGLANHIHWLKDGEAVLDYLSQGHAPPRMILLDLKLPKVSGLEILKEIRANDRFRATPVVVMTSSKEDRDVEMAYSIGANSYIVKPVDFAQFSDVVSKVGLYWLLVNEPPRGSVDADGPQS